MEAKADALLNAELYWVTITQFCKFFGYPDFEKEFAGGTRDPERVELEAAADMHLHWAAPLLPLCLGAALGVGGP